jgi:Ca-activated chloride channel family protein
VLKTDTGLVSYLYPLNTEKFSAKPVHEVSIKVALETTRPLKTMYSPSHNVEIRRHGAHEAAIGFEAREVRPDTDFQVFFAPEADDIGINLMAQKLGADDGYFLLLASPGAETKEKKVIPKDITFVLDTSGSMAGKKLDQAKKALQFCVENLNDGDRFEVLRFSTDTEPLFNRLTEASTGNRARAGEFIHNLSAIGGTAIDDALQKALALRPDASDRPYVIIFLTDGMPTIGETDEDRIVANAKTVSHGNTRVFCFGIGNDVNTHLLDKIADATKAFGQYVLPDEDIEVKVSTFVTKIKEPVLTNLRFTFPEGVRVTKLYPSPLPDLFKGDQLLLAGRYSGSGNGKVVLEGSVNGVSRKFTYDLRFPETAAGHDFIPRLWATRRVGYLLDEIRLHGEKAEVRDEVADLARHYGIVTPYTAYLIVEDEARRNVPVSAQALPTLNAPEVQLQTRALYREFKDTRSGERAAMSSRYGLELKTATSASATIANGNLDALALATSRGGASESSPAAGKVVSQLAETVQQTKVIDGRAVYLNDGRWIDSKLQKMPKAERVRVQFGSTDYFDLIAKHTEALRWVALGRNVQFALGEKIYEVYE